MGGTRRVAYLIRPSPTPLVLRTGHRAQNISTRTHSRWLMADSSNLAPRSRRRRDDAVHREELLHLAPDLGPVADRPGRRRQSLEHRGPIALGDDAPI